ncbi:Ig-like domain repeat protein [Streptomyces violaceusniger]
MTFTATVIPLGVGTPSGTVTFIITGGPTLMGTLVGGTISVTATGLSVGTHVVAALYSGDTNFLTSTGTNAIVVVPASTTTSVMSSPNPSALGQPVTFTATITPVAPGAGTPGGTVTGSGTLSGGVATFTTSALDANATAYTVTGVYNPDTATFLTSTGTDTHTVNRADTKVTITSIPNPSTVGETVSYIAFVEAVPPGTGVPTGNVATAIDVMDQTVFFTSVALDSNGFTLFTDNAFPAGAYTVSSQYEGDANFNASPFDTDPHIINP